MNIIKVSIITFSIFVSYSLIAKPGQDIFDRYCTVCHSPSMAPMFSAPAAHDLNAWTIRKNDALTRVTAENQSLEKLDNIEKEKQAIKALVASAIAGTEKGMPPMGTCAECSEDDLTNAIKFMSSSE